VPTDPAARTPRLLRSVAWAALAAAVAAAGALALVRLGDPSSRRLIELVTLTPLGLPLAAAGVVASLVLLVTTDGRRLPGLVLVAALALLGVHAWWLAPLYVGSASAAESPPLVVMSLNFEIGDAGDLVEATREHDVDVLVLLEVSRSRMDGLRAAGITTGLPHTAGVEDDHVLGTVVLSRFPVVAYAPLYDGSDSLVVDLDVAGIGQVGVVGVHTRPPYRPESWRADHDQTFAALSRLRADEERVLLAGDFNATLAHAPMRRILGLGFADAADQVGGGWSPTWPTGGHEHRLGLAVPPFAPIDHVLTAPGLVITGAETLEVGGADHLAVLALVSGDGS
jgi:endonuclease/exonuclease/phosphatase (EEP) superfamily protein YafD